MGTLHTIRPAARQAQPAKPQLRPLALLQVAHAEKFLADMETLASGGDPLRAAFWLGQAQSHLQSMVDVVRAVTELPR